MNRLLAILSFLSLVPLLVGQSVSDDRTSLVSKAHAKEFVAKACEHELRGISGYWSPTLQDARGLEDGLLAYLKMSRPEAATYFEANDGEKLKDGWQWFRRYVAGIVVAGEKFLLVSYECQDPRETKIRESEVRARMEKMGKKYDPDGWKEEWRSTMIHHGGYSYFRVVFSPRNRRFIWYEENAPQGVMEFPAHTLAP